MPFTTVQLFKASVPPVSNPPSLVGERRVALLNELLVEDELKFTEVPIQIVLLDAVATRTVGIGFTVKLILPEFTHPLSGPPELSIAVTV